MRKNISRIVVAIAFLVLGVAIGLSILNEQWEYVVPIAVVVGVLIVLDLKYFNPMNK